MRLYWIKTNAFVTWLFPKYLWNLNRNENKVYITFDDGPVPTVTPWVLDQLKKYNAKATFFCIGDNVQKHPTLANRVLDEGHALGNHTYNHVCGWETKRSTYAENTQQCTKIIEEVTKVQTQLFRPPYGKITFPQANDLLKKGYKIVMWDVLSADFDTSITPEKCVQNVLRNIEPGSIIIFHDSEKAFVNLKFALPLTLKFIQEKGFDCDIIS